MPRRAVLSVAFVLVPALGVSACSSSTHTSTLPATTATASPTSPSPTITTTSGTAPARSTPTTASACDRPHSSGQSAQTFDFQGVQRTYQLYVPATYDGTRAVPVVFDFHGYGSNAVQQMVYGDFRPEADRDGFVIVAPDGQAAKAGRHFNFTGERGLQNDVQMVGALLDHIEATLCIDSDRVYATGMSDGGAMTSVLACTMPNRFAAFGAVAVIVYRKGCGGAHPIAITAISGTADPVVPFNGGHVRCCGGAPIAAARDSVAGWAAQNHCEAQPHEQQLSSEVRRRYWTGCRAGGAVNFYIIEGGGHTWPGSIPVPKLGMTTRQLDASATLWQFFREHPLVNG